MKIPKQYKLAIQNLATRLPKSYELRKTGVISMNKDLPLKMQSKIDTDDTWFKVFKNKFEEINHINRLESAYKRNKEQGIVDYIYWLNNNNKNLNAKYEQLKLESASDDLLDIAKKGAKGFWKNLLDFLFAFLKIFLNKD